MKTIRNLLCKSRLLTLMALCLSLTFTMSCGDDDDDEGGGSIDAASYKDFIEITVDGKTFKQEFFPLYSSMDVSAEYEIQMPMEDFFEDENFDLSYNMVVKSKFEALKNSKPGQYRITYNSIESTDVHNFDFSLSYEARLFSGEDFSYEAVDGVNNVTSVEERTIKTQEFGKSKVVAIEGNFTADMIDKNSDQKKKITGKYRMTAF